MILAYALPHILVGSVTNSTIQGRFRHSFWNEVYETVLAWYIMRPVLLAMVNPKLGKFNVTAKGGVIDNDYFDWRMARPYIVVLVLNLIGAVVGLVKLGTDPATTTVLLINLGWTFYNIIIISAAVAVAGESRQIRGEPRVFARLPATLWLADGTPVACTTNDFSQGGLGIRLPDDVSVPNGSPVHVSLSRDDEECVLPAVVRFSHGQVVGLRFSGLDLTQQQNLIRMTFSRADLWAANWGKGAVDTPLGALAEVSAIGLRGFRLLSRASWAVLVRQLRSISLSDRSASRDL
jgi:cellulose synthase (UDP-forming)